MTDLSTVKALAFDVGGAVVDWLRGISGQLAAIGAKLLACEPHQVMMVAAHDMDLAAARKQGMRTAFIHRPHEWGEGATPVQTPDAATDIVAGDLIELAERLGA